MMLFLIPLVYAIDECTPIMEQAEAENCTITTSWAYPNICASYTAQIYNSTGAEIQSKTLEDFGATNLCRFNWNKSEEGSYFFNTSLDTGNIIVRGEMALIATSINWVQHGFVFGGYLVAVFILILFMHLFKQDRGTGMVYGIIATVLAG